VPELPDLTVYAERVEALAGGEPLRELKLLHPFVLRTVTPPVAELTDQPLERVHRVGKRLALQFGPRHFALVHLMRAGRLRWLDPERKPPGRIALAIFRFDRGQLLLTEAGTRRRASLHLVAAGGHQSAAAALAPFDPGGIEPLGADPAAFRERLRRENHTLKRSLTDPKTIAGIGNAYSDEILHRAKLSPLALTQKLDEAEHARLYDAVQDVLTEWIERLRREAGRLPYGLPDVTAFRPEMAVHGKFGAACPVCGAPVQRIVYADTETDYCARCQTAGRILADRALSRLLKASFPASLDELEL
jgi:formamidopyrimidine-DNA glycosylase